MSVRQKFASGAMILAGGKAVTQAASLGRTVIVAGIIGTANMGIAATFTLTIGFLESISAVSGDKLLVQDREGDSERMQGSVQSVQVVRAIILAVAIFLLAAPMAALFGAPQATDAYRALAVIPLLRGFQHLDQKRRHREMRYFRDTVATTLPAVLMLAAAYPVAVWLGDYRAVLGLLVFGSVTQTLATHLLSERRFRLGWDRSHVSRVFRFGWPLTVNGLLMFVILQGDNFVIGSGAQLFGSSYTLDDLGVYFVAVTLAMAPTAAVASISSALMLSLLSRVQDQPAAFLRRYRLSIAGLCVLAAAISPLLIVAGPPMTTILFGAEYASVVQVLGVLAAMQALRMIRVAPTLAAMSRGDTRTLMVTNIVRVLAFGGAIYAATLDAQLVWIAASGLAGEVLALAVSFARIKRLHSLPFMASLPGTALAVGSMMLAGVAFVILRDASATTLLACGLLLAISAASISALSLRTTRVEAASMLRKIHQRFPAGTAA